MVRRFPEHLPHPVTVSFRRAHAAAATHDRSARSRAGVDRRRLAIPPRPHGTHAAQFRPRRAPASAPLFHDRCHQRQHQLRHRAGENRFSRAPVEKSLARTGNGRNFSAAERAGRAGELRRVALRQGAGEPELHAVRSHHRRVRQTMRHQDRHHLAQISGEDQAHAAGRGDLSGRRRRRPTGSSNAATSRSRPALRTAITAGTVFGAPT